MGQEIPKTALCGFQKWEHFHSQTLKSCFLTNRYFHLRPKVQHRPPRFPKFFDKIKLPRMKKLKNVDIHTIKYPAQSWTKLKVIYEPEKKVSPTPNIGLIHFHGSGSLLSTLLRLYVIDTSTWRQLLSTSHFNPFKFTNPMNQHFILSNVNIFIFFQNSKRKCSFLLNKKFGSVSQYL